MSNSDYKSILTSWGLANYISKFEEEEYDDIETWDTLMEDNGAALKDELGMKGGAKAKFIKNYKKQFGGNSTNNDETPIGGNGTNNETPIGGNSSNNEIPLSGNSNNNGETPFGCNGSNNDETQFEGNSNNNDEKKDDEKKEPVGKSFVDQKTGKKCKGLYKSVLKSWDLERYIDAFDDEGYDDIESWSELIQNDGAILINDLKMKKGHKGKFIKLYKKHYGSNDDIKDDEKREIIKSNEPMGKLFRDPKTGKKCKGFYVIPSKKASSNKNSPYYNNFKNNTMINSGQRHKVILVVGQTGAGKSTVLNSMINYIYGIHFEDKFRYKLIVEAHKPGGQAVSQTDHVTSYELPDKNNILGYKLTVVDTPGFGDTRGVDKDIEIMKDIKLWFEKKLDTLDAVCFVVKATDARLTPTQKYIFSSILNLFGKDIKKNIYILITFADTSKPPALAAIAEEHIEYQKYFKLNNSVFFKNPLNNSTPQDKIFDKLYWNMGIECFKLFFDDLKTTIPVSLTMSRQVLKDREIITSKIEMLNKKLDIGLAEVQEIEKQKKWVKAHQDELNANAEQPYYQRQKYWREKYTGNNIITTCKTCPNQTCHPNCGVADKTHCGVMRNGKCTVCGCPAWNHENRNYVWEEAWKTVKKTKWEGAPGMKQRYQNAKNNQTRAQQILDGCDYRLRETERFVQGCISNIQQAINSLSKIALNKNVLTTKDYIDKVIKMETEQKKPGWQSRIKSLKKLGKQAEVTAKIQQNQFSFRDLIGWR